MDPIREPNVLALFFAVAVAMALLLLPVSGCGLPTAVNDVDPDKAAGVVLALGMAGFDGNVEIGPNGEADFYLKESFGARSPGAYFKASGHMNPAAVTPETRRAYLDAMRLLGVDPPPPGPATAEAASRVPGPRDRGSGVGDRGTQG